MFWFKKKEEGKKPPYIPGDRFEYLGIEMTCVNNIVHGLGKSWPAVVAEYKDNHGVIRSKTFHEDYFELI